VLRVAWRGVVQLYIYDRLVNELLDASTNAEGNLLHEVLRRSAGLCLQKYEKPVLAPESHLRLMELVGIHTVRPLPSLRMHTTL